MNNISIYSSSNQNGPKNLSLINSESFYSTDNYTRVLCIEKNNNSDFILIMSEWKATNEALSLIGNLSSDALTFNALENFKTGVSYRHKMAKILDNSYLIFYTDGDRPNSGDVVELTVSGNTITTNNPVINATTTTSIISGWKDIVKLTDTTALIIYVDGNYNLAASIVNINTPNLSVGTKQILYSSEQVYLPVAAYAKDNYVICACYFPSINKIKTFILEVSGTTINISSFYDTSFVVNGSSNINSSISFCDQNTAIIAYNDGVNMILEVLNVDYTTLSISTLHTLKTTLQVNDFYFEVSHIKNEHFFCTYSSTLPTSGVYAFTFSYTNGIIEVGTPLFIETKGTTINANCIMNSNRALVFTNDNIKYFSDGPDPTVHVIKID